MQHRTGYTQVHLTLCPSAQGRILLQWGQSTAARAAAAAQLPGGPGPGREGCPWPSACCAASGELCGTGLTWDQEGGQPAHAAVFVALRMHGVHPERACCRGHQHPSAQCHPKESIPWGSIGLNAGLARPPVLLDSQG